MLQEFLHPKLNTILSDEPPRNSSDSQSNLITSALPVIRSGTTRPNQPRGASGSWRAIR